MKFIELTRTDGKKIVLNLKYVDALCQRADGKANVFLNNEPKNHIKVLENYEDVITRLEGSCNISVLR